MATKRKPQPSARVRLDKLFQAAQAHGAESEPDMEVGDLQTMLAVAYELLTPEAKDAFYDHPEVSEVREWLQ